MENSYPWEAQDEIEELEAVEEPAGPELESGAPLAESPLMSEAGTRSVIHSYGQIPEPLALLDESLEFVFRNGPFRELLKAFGYPESSTFFGTLSRSISPETARAIRESLNRAEAGHAWKGTIAHKAKNAAAVITKVHIFPFYSENEHEPRERGRKAREPSRSTWTTSPKKTEIPPGHVLLAPRGLEAQGQRHGQAHRASQPLYASLLAKAMYNDPRWPEMDKDFIEDIGFLAAMHDVGQDRHARQYPEQGRALSSEFEWGIMKEHTINGAFILSSYPNPMAREIALSHHEWWNGSGYPYNMEGKMIPLSARIVTVADVYDALRMKRSYKPAYSHETAMQKIRRSGKSTSTPTSSTWSCACTARSRKSTRPTPINPSKFFTKARRRLCWTFS